MAPASSSEGSYTWRGGNKILLEKMEDRFTVMPGDSRQLERVRSAAEARAVEPVTNQVFRIETTSTQRDGMMERLRSPTFRAVVHHAYRPAGSDGTIYYLTDRILVSFKHQVKSADIDAILTKYALRLLKVYAFRHNTFLVQVTDSSGANPIKIANRLAEEPDVRTAEPNMVNRFRPMFHPPDPLFIHQWHLHAEDGPQVLAAASVNAPAAWDITRGDRSIVVAVIDDGFDLNHPDFTGPNKIVHPKDYVDGDAQPFPDSHNQDYHGTPTAGVAVAESNGIGVVGVIHRATVGPILNGLAAHPDVVAVSASTSLNKHAAYSNWGPEISLCAPSNNFHPLLPGTFVPGLGIWTTDNEAMGLDFQPGSRYTGGFGGTSSATPLVAGVAALILSTDPDLSAKEVRSILESTADKIVDTAPDIISGHNRGQYDAARRCDWFGHGKVNAAAAVAEAHRRASNSP